MSFFYFFNIFSSALKTANVASSINEYSLSTTNLKDWSTNHADAFWYWLELLLISFLNYTKFLGLWLFQKKKPYHRDIASLFLKVIVTKLSWCISNFSTNVLNNCSSNVVISSSCCFSSFMKLFNSFSRCLFNNCKLVFLLPLFFALFVLFYFLHLYIYNYTCK